MPFAYKSPFACTVCCLQDWRWIFKGSKSSLSQVSENLAHIWSIPLKDWNNLCFLAIWDNDFSHGGSNTTDGLSNGLLSDDSAGLEGSREIIADAWSDIADNGGFIFQAGFEFFQVFLVDFDDKFRFGC